MRKLDFKNPTSARELIKASFSSSIEHRFLGRLHCVLLVVEGRSCYEVARWFGKDPRTVERWVHGFDQRGIAALREHRSGGRPAKLSAKQVQRLAHDLQKPPHASGYPEREWSGRRLAQHLELCYGTKLSTRQCQRVMRRLDGARIAPNTAGA